MKVLLTDIQFHEEVRLLVWRPRGVLSEAALEQIVTLIGDLEASSEIPFNRFTDTTAAEAIDLNFRHVFHVALFRRLSYAGRPPVKSAILVTSFTVSHYSKLHELLTRSSSIRFASSKRVERPQRLGVPVELLKL
jgi:hypothetical protein